MSNIALLRLTATQASHEAKGVGSTLKLHTCFKFDWHESH